jgi:hypothetical protein
MARGSARRHFLRIAAGANLSFYAGPAKRGENTCDRPRKSAYL